MGVNMKRFRRLMHGVRILLSTVLSVALVLGLMPGMSMKVHAVGGFYNTYLVTTELNSDKSGDARTALQVTFKGVPWYIIVDN